MSDQSNLPELRKYGKIKEVIIKKGINVDIHKNQFEYYYISFIEIIEKESPELLEVLEDYLQIQEQLGKIISARDSWKETIQKLDEIAKTPDADNKDAIISAVKPFFELMDSKFRKEDDPNNMQDSKE